MGNLTRSDLKEGKGNRDIQIGKAGEHLVCSDLIYKGYNAFMVSDPTSPVDILLSIDNSYVRIQVKTTIKQKFNVGKKRVKSQTPVFIFNGSMSGYKGRTHYTQNEIDMYAFVEMENKRIAYYPFIGFKGNITLRLPELRGQYKDEKWKLGDIEVKKMKEEGFSPKEIATKMNVPLTQIYSYNTRLTKKHRYNVKYLDEFPIEKCLEQLAIQKTQHAD